MSAFITFLRNRLQNTLPGFDAQKKMMPVPLDGGPNPRRQVPSDAVARGVMILVHPDPEERLSLVFTLRSEEIEQGGQICFPGGRAESLETPAEAAIRETEEEIGVPGDKISEIGKLTTLYVNTSNSLIHPTVGYLPEIPQIEIDPYEVQEVFNATLETLIDPDQIITETWKLRGRKFIVPYWDIHDVPLWGATAMILAEFTTLYEEYKKAHS